MHGKKTSHDFDRILENGEMNSEIWSNCSIKQMALFFNRYPESIRGLIDEKTRELSEQKYAGLSIDAAGEGDAYIIEHFSDMTIEIMEGIHLGLDEIWFDYILAHVESLRIKLFKKFIYDDN